MERKESIVVQTAPDYENIKINEMEKFGWELQGRQEVHESGMAFATQTSDDGSYVINQIVSKYVKLHFARSLNFPNLDKIKQIESEFNNLPFPSGDSPIGPYIFTLFWMPGALGGLVNLLFPDMRIFGVVLLIIFGLLIFAGIRWIIKRKIEREAANQVCIQSTRRARELIAQVESITVGG